MLLERCRFAVNRRQQFGGGSRLKRLEIRFRFARCEVRQTEITQENTQEEVR